MFTVRILVTMNFKIAKTFLLVSLVAYGTVNQSCKKNNPVADEPDYKVPKMEDVLSGNDQNLINLLNKVRGSVGKRGPASKTIWSRKNEYGLGLYLSANHVYGLSGWSSRYAQVFDLNSERLGVFETSQLPPINGEIALGNTLIADFPLMHFDISDDATNTTILPEEDFYFGIIDNQRTQQGPVVKHPDFIQNSIPLQMYDPNMRTKANQTWSLPIAGEKVIAVGYPQDNINYPNGAVVNGKILSNAESVSIVQELKTAGDSEGDISYNPTVEFFVDAQAIAGMSGGGVFNSEGQLLGIMVRASDKKKAPKIIRVVKISYIKSKMNAFYEELSAAKKNMIRPFINGEL